MLAVSHWGKVLCCQFPIGGDWLCWHNSAIKVVSGSLSSVRKDLPRRNAVGCISLNSAALEADLEALLFYSVICIAV